MNFALKKSRVICENVRMIFLTQRFYYNSADSGKLRMNQLVDLMKRVDMHNAS